MKRILIALLLTVAPTLAFADEFPYDPETFCRSGCTETMKQIVADFREQGAMPDVSVLPMVGSGNCFHLQRSIDPEHPHWGLLVLDPNQGNPLFQALFSFFPKENPWAGMSFEKAKEYAISRGSNPRATTYGQKDLRTRITSEKADFFYWVRAIPERNELIMISLWTYKEFASNYAFCRMNMH